MRPFAPSLLPASLLLLAGAALAAAPAEGQCVSLTTLGSPVVQNFDTLSNTAGSTTNNLTLPGWFMTEAGGGARDNEQYAVDTGASTTGDTYSYGAAAASDRALGALRSGTLIPNFGACFTNNTGATVSSLLVAYTGEEWRFGTVGRADQLNFEYSLDATSLTTGAWINVAALNFVTPDTSTVGAKDGNAAASRTALSSTIPALAIANGANFWIRWTDIDVTGADDGLSVDQFSLTPNALVGTNLSINDVSLNEGNAGTTNFTFTVSLSAPAGPGGVTFDIATADGTAQDDNPPAEDNDYVPQALTGQTIPAGSSTFAFTVQVNGDLAPEVNETFLVNVTNVTGATAIDGQGQGTIVNDDAAPNLTINDVSLAEGNAGTTNFVFTVSLSAPAGPGGVTFDIATADGTAQDDTPPAEDNDYVSQALTGQTIFAGSSTYAFTVQVNGDLTPETDQTFFVNVTNVTNAIAVDSQGLGTIQNDDLTRIHDVQGNGAATPIPGATVSVQGVVIGDYQPAAQLSGFFLQEEDADVDADPATSEGIFVFCSGCPTAVAEGQRVRVTGTVSEFFGTTEITAATPGAVVVVEAGNHLGEITPSPIDLPVVGVVNDFYETREGMKVTFVDSLTVSEYFELPRFGQIELFEGGRPRQFTEMSPPSVPGYAAHLEALSRRRVILDDDDNVQNVSLLDINGNQFIYPPRANGGFSVGTQGIDFFRGGDLVNGLTGVLDWSFAGVSGTDAWRIRPTAANPATFTVANPRPATPPAVGGAIKAVGMNLLNYFTTIDTTASDNSGPCGPSGTLDCRGADSVAELARQRERASIVICTLNADVYGFGELENTTPSASITDLLGAVNTRCGGAHPYTFANTGGTLGTDAIRVQIIYRTGILSPVGAPLSDLDPIHSRPPTAQTFDVVDAANPAFGERFTVVANHLKSKGSSAGLPGDADIGDGAGFSNATRTAQAARLLAWISSTVLPAAGDPDVLLVGDFNSYPQETPVTTLLGGGYTDLESALLGPAAYSYVFDAQLGHLDYAFSSTSLTPQITGVGAWHINADEADLLDYNDEIRDAGEAAFEEKPDGSALVPPRVLFQPATPYRASDHDPVLVGIFQIADLAITKTDSPDPVVAGTNLTYTITVNNNGPDPAAAAAWSDTLPAGTAFVSLSAAAGWTCSTPAVGSGGTVSCSIPTLAVSSAFFTLTVSVGPGVAAGTVLPNTATVGADAGDPTPGNNSATATTTVTASANLSVSKVDTPDPVTAGTNLGYTITVANAGPSQAAAVSLSDTLPAGTTFVSLSSPAGWSCTTPAVGSGGTVSCSIPALATGNAVFTLTVQVGPSVPSGTVLSNTATVGSSTPDPAPGNESGTATTTVGASADLSVTKVDTPDPVVAGANLTYTLTVANAGPSAAASATLSDTLPPSTSFVSFTPPAGWSCTAPPVGGTGTVSCSNPLLAPGSSVFTLVVAVDPATTGASVLTNSATAASATPDPNTGNETGTATTNVAASADLSVSKVDTPDPVIAGTNLTYTITLTNAGPSQAANAALTDTLPVGETFVSLTAPGGWTCTTPAVGSPGTVDCSIASLPLTSAVFTLVVNVAPTIPALTVLSNSATGSSSASDPNPGNETGTAATQVAASADLSMSKVDTPDPVSAGSSLTYSLTATNAGPSSAANAALTDTLPAGTTFGSLAAPAGWSCTTPAVGSGGTVSCTNGSFAVGSAVFTLVVPVAPTVAGGTVLTNVATVTAETGDPASGNESGTATTTVLSASGLSATKSVATSGNPGSPVTYTVVITNAGPGAQADNPGDEFIDPLPAELDLIGASASSGIAAADPGTGVVTWNGAIPAGGSVTIVIDAVLAAEALPGTPIENQGTISFDADGNGTNETTGVTDDPATGDDDDPTQFVVENPVGIVEIPALDSLGLAALAAILALAGLARLRRSPRRRAG
jgi:uncharacterized repeat protein (TIGR01451 family)